MKKILILVSVLMVVIQSVSQTFTNPDEFVYYYELKQRPSEELKIQLEKINEGLRIPIVNGDTIGCMFTYKEKPNESVVVLRLTPVKLFGQGDIDALVKEFKENRGSTTIENLLICIDNYITKSIIPKLNDNVELYVNNIHINNLDSKYIRIVGTSKFLSTKIVVRLEFGQSGLFTDKRITIGKNGKIFNFNSMVSAMNYMSKYGYKFSAAYVITVGNQNVYHYLMGKN